MSATASSSKVFSFEITELLAAFWSLRSATARKARTNWFFTTSLPVLTGVRSIEVGLRVLLLFSIFPSVWLAA
jgi:hypothetical protein